MKTVPVVYLSMGTDDHSCSYCSDTFSSEEKLLDHLAGTHRDELGTIDERRVNEHTQPGTFQRMVSENIGGIVLVGIIGFAVVAVGIMAMTGGGGDALPEEIPAPDKSTNPHAHGTMELYVNGNQVDLTQSAFQGTGKCFHFHPGQDTAKFHMHCGDVTPAYAMYNLGFPPLDNATTVTYDGETFDTTEGDTVSVVVNGQDVNPYEFTLRDGDRLVVRLNNTN